MDTLRSRSCRLILPALACLLAAPSLHAATGTSYLPGAAETPGRNGAFFSSTLTITNVSWTAAYVSVGFIPYPEKPVPAPVSFVLAGGESQAIEHVLASLFGLTADAGTLSVSSSSPLVLLLTTSNIADSAGTYGLSLQPVASDAALKAGETGHAVWASQSADTAKGYRTNVSVTLLDPGSSVDARVFDERGLPLSLIHI